MSKIESPVSHQMHGATFTSYVAPSRGSQELCAWKVRVERGVQGQPHEISREEVFLVLKGTPTLTVDGRGGRLLAGDVVLAKAGSTVRLDNEGATEAEIWVATSVGLTALMPDGASIVPPWSYWQTSGSGEASRTGPNALSATATPRHWTLRCRERAV